MTILKLIKLIKEVSALPRVTLTFVGGSNRAIFNYFVKPHARYLIVKNKSIGLCVLKKPQNIEEYLSGKKSNILRTNTNKAIKRGYSVKRINVREYIQQTLEINQSMSFRQGRAMGESYSDLDATLKIADNTINYGAFSGDGKLVGYVYLSLVGNFINITRILGHGDYIRDGVMYLLIFTIVTDLINNSFSKAQYLVYDTWYGAQSGLREFKKNCHLLPHIASFKYVDVV